MEIQRLPGFRDFYPYEYAWRNYICEGWRNCARSFGFVEYDGPTLEATDLYRKKSGEELKTQLFRFFDPGERDICLRPEMTPTLARLVAARERDFKKPIKWFSIASFFRFEKPQKGRLREFFQVNCDLIGDSSAAADAELIALAVAMFRGFGLTENDFYVRVNNRRLWLDFIQKRDIPPERLTEFLAIIDKIEREEQSATARRLADFNVTWDEVQAFLQTPAEAIPGFEALAQELRWRGVAEMVKLDLTVVRGLDYYTGLVFEVFDRQRQNRALAGGGRYDNLINVISDGAVDLPAAGFAIGDVVLQNLLQELPHTRTKADNSLAMNRPRAFVIIADENRRPEGLRLVAALRENQIVTDFSLQPIKVGKQFQMAESVDAQFAVVVGQEWPQVKLKNLQLREETTVSIEVLINLLKS
ncbi:MAG TPA: histidine--tRNA ligase [Chthoniobacterales bacterium]|nr:histidine--tRNA ligase [Chthoniobacterales bacterium]